MWSSKECTCCVCDPSVHLSVPSICFFMSEVISSFKSLRAGSQVFALLMLSLCVILHTMWSDALCLGCQDLVSCYFYVVLLPLGPELL